MGYIMTAEAKSQTINSFDFLKDLGDYSKRLLMPILKEVRFRKGDPVFFRGDGADSMYFVLHGSVEISIATEEGRKIILSILPQGSSFGEIGVLDGGQRTANAVALDNCYLWKLDQRDFMKAMENFPAEDWMKITRQLCALLRRVNYNLETFCLGNAETRLVSKLYELGQKADTVPSSEMTLKISQSQLAEMTNLSRETTNRILSQMEKDGFIKRSYGKITIFKLSKLFTYDSQSACI
jgi:CRP/FNR family transcriptional regulator, cyclic AMP receptor protein